MKYSSASSILKNRSCLPESTYIENTAAISIDPSGSLLLGENNTIFDGCEIEIGNGSIKTGDGVVFGPRSKLIIPFNSITIGENTTIGSGVIFSCTRRQGDRPNRRRRGGVDQFDIRIGHDVRIGAGCIVTPGAQVRDGITIPPGSVVSGRYSSQSVCETKEPNLPFLVSRDGPLKLHLGCGKRHIPGFIHIDAQPQPHLDMVTDIARIVGIPDRSVDMIYASHVLEHFGRWEFRNVLAEWYRLLRPGGLLRLAVPDFGVVMKLYHSSGLADGLNGLLGLVCGGQRDSFDFHKMVFDEGFLRHELTGLGFRNIRRWDWRQTEHADHDDYSQAHLPHLDKETGTLVSLNLEAER